MRSKKYRGRRQSRTKRFGGSKNSLTKKEFIQFIKKYNKKHKKHKTKGGNKKKVKRRVNKRKSIKRRNQKGGMMITDMLLNTYRLGENEASNIVNTMKGNQPNISVLPEHQPIYDLDRVEDNVPVRRDPWNQ